MEVPAREGEINAIRNKAQVSWAFRNLDMIARDGLGSQLSLPNCQRSLGMNTFPNN